MIRHPIQCLSFAFALLATLPVADAAEPVITLPLVNRT